MSDEQIKKSEWAEGEIKKCLEELHKEKEHKDYLKRLQWKSLNMQWRKIRSKMK